MGLGYLICRIISSLFRLRPTCVLQYDGTVRVRVLNTTVAFGKINGKLIRLKQLTSIEVRVRLVCRSPMIYQFYLMDPKSIAMFDPV